MIKLVCSYVNIFFLCLLSTNVPTNLDMLQPLERTTFLTNLAIIYFLGIVGSILAKEGHMSNLSDFVSGAFKVLFPLLK